MIFLHRSTSHPENKVIESRYGISCHPTFLYLNHKGELLSSNGGAAQDETEFINDCAYCLDPNNYINNKRKSYKKGKISSKDYLDHCKRMNLKFDMSNAFNDIFLEYKNSGRIKEFFLEYCSDFRTITSLNSIDNEFYDYISNHNDEIIAMDSTLIQPLNYLRRLPENAIERLLKDMDYTKSEYSLLEDYVKNSDSKPMKIKLEALSRCKKEGLEGIISVFSDNIDKLEPMEIYMLNLYIYRYHISKVKEVPYLKEYIEKCRDISDDRRLKRFCEDLLE